MPSRLGSPNKDKPFKRELQRLIVQAEEKGGPRRLELVARALIHKAIEGDVPAIKEVAERLDGRTSLIDGQDAASLLLASIKVMFINAGQNSDSEIPEQAPLSLSAE